ncbi:MAG: hypothetical protein HWD90_10830 [Campylobacteraceae bacterium]|nr:hypothetical protein [Campylobacteraceae bacterium]
MKLKYKKTNLEIYIKNKQYDYNINTDIDVEYIRNLFNNSIGKLSQKHNSIEYWLMKLSERNTLTHDLFLDICKIYLLKSLNKQYKNIEIYTNNITFYLYFSSFVKMSLKDILFFEVKRILIFNKPYLQTIKFLINKLIFIMKYKSKESAKPIQNTTIIQTWVSDNNFKNNSFKDSYYGDLFKYLQKKSKKVITWPVFYNVKNEAKAVSFIRKYNDDFILIEDYLKPADYLEAIKHFIKKRFLNLGIINIGNEDFSKVFKYYQNIETIEEVSLFYNFTKRLKEKRSNNIVFIHNHENMISEKALVLGVKKHLKDSKVIGYFHTTKPRNQLCLEYASLEEFNIAPKPELIIFNNYKYRKYFENAFPEMRFKDGVAFKQLHLKNKIEKNNNKKNKVLVLFSGTNDEIKLMFDLLNNLKDDYEFIFRMHPMNRFNVKKYYKKENYEVENEISLDILLNQVLKVISTYSAVALESALSGVSVGLLYNKKRLLLNPFDDTNIENYKLISNYKELESFLITNFKNKIVEQSFNIKDENYKIFLEVTK